MLLMQPVILRLCWILPVLPSLNYYCCYCRSYPCDVLSMVIFEKKQQPWFPVVFSVDLAERVMFPVLFRNAKWKKVSSLIRVLHRSHSSEARGFSPTGVCGGECRWIGLLTWSCFLSWSSFCFNASLFFCFSKFSTSSLLAFTCFSKERMRRSISLPLDVTPSGR